MSTSVRRPSISKRNIVFFQNRILTWFEISGRHYFPWRQKGLSEFQIIIAEVLLQRTKAETVEKFYLQFIADFPHWKALALAEVSVLEERLKPIGLYRQRATRIKGLATEMVRVNGQIPAERAALEKVPMLGQYIVNAILLQVFNKRIPLLDVNMARVLERYFGERTMADIRYDPYLQDLALKVVDHLHSKELSWGILDFAAIICKARKPLCNICPISSSCNFYKKNLY
jgi:A/G-specific DNA glycosylase